MTDRRTLERFCLLMIVLSPVAGLLSGGSFWQVSHAQRAQQNAKGIFANLKVGQTIAIKEEAGRYVVLVMPGTEQAQEIREVGDDYLSVVDQLGARESRIPVYSIKAINTVLLPR